MEVQDFLAIAVFLIWAIGVWSFRRDLIKKYEQEQREIKNYHQYYEDVE